MMIKIKIDSAIIESYLGVISSKTFDSLGLINSNIANTLTFLDDDKFLDGIVRNDNIKGVITTQEFVNELNIKKKNLQIFLSKDPRYDFYSIQNGIAELYEFRNHFETVIDESANVHKTAYISSKNVIIGKNVLIEPNVTILDGVEIRENSIIRSGAVLGTEGFEFKRTSKGVLSVKHDGKVYIGSNVEIGSNAAIARGFSFRHTLVGDDTKVDNLVHIAHGAQIGKRCFFPAGSVISGGVLIGDDVWIGPNSTVSSQVTIKDGAYVTLGSVVVRNVKSNEKVTGNFAIPHNQFLESLKDALSRK